MRPLAFLLLSLVAALSLDEGSASGANASDDPCGKHPKDFQVYEGVCLPDRLVGYIKCVAATGGNQLRVTRIDSSGSDSKLRIGAAGKGEGVVIKGEGQADLNKESVERAIRNVDIIYGNDATSRCLVAAGISTHSSDTTAETAPRLGTLPPNTAPPKQNPPRQQNSGTRPKSSRSKHVRAPKEKTHVTTPAEHNAAVGRQLQDRR